LQRAYGCGFLVAGVVVVFIGRLIAVFVKLVRVKSVSKERKTAKSGFSPPQHRDWLFRRGCEYADKTEQ
jgi:hypothetical protein